MVVVVIGFTVLVRVHRVHPEEVILQRVRSLGRGLVTHVKTPG